MRGELPLSVYSDGSHASMDDVHTPLNTDFSMTRSEEMQYVTITIPNELVTETVNALGDFGMLHIVDLSTSNEMTKHQFAYKKRTTEVADLEKKLKNFEDQMHKRGIPVAVEDFDTPLGAFADVAYQRNPDVVVGAADFAAEFDVQLTSNLAFERSVQTEIARRQELRVTLQESDKLIPAGASAVSNDIESGGSSQTYDRFMSSMSSQSLERDGNGISSYICGVIPVKNQSVFTRLVYRTSRGSNAIVKFSETPISLIDPITGEDTMKVVFCVVTIGSQLYKRVQKICPLVNATVYPVPSGQPAVIAQEITRLDSEIREQQQALAQTSTTITRILSTLAEPQQLSGAWGPCPLRLWQQVLFREKVMIDTLMKCEFHSTLVFMGGWCPVNKLEDLAFTLQSASQGSGAKPALDRNASPPKAAAVPPTYILGNKFTESFQAIINTYGFPKYGEFNPGLFTIVLFPFLFGVMYGDVGHGTIITLVGALFLVFEKSLMKASKEKRLNEMIDMVFGGRYVILLMGLFAIYCGIIYNDVMSIPMNIYGSNFHHTEENTYVWTGEVYPFGMDPGWYHKKNSLKFFNSFKMKMAVTIGVIQMTFGMFLSLYNHLYFNDMISILFEFLPRLFFFLCIFGYMIAMIFIKWCTDWAALNRDAPNLIQTMIDMFLSPGSVAKENLLYEGQETVQLAFLLIAVFCIPMMLLPKPFIEQGKRKGGCKLFASCHSPADDEYQAKHGPDHSSDDLALTHHMHSSSDHDEVAESATGEDHEEHSFGDVMIHQSIHTIEFILGSVSNTASYLRLWALSLAHAQLAEVFWEKMVAEYGYENSGIITFCGTAVWAVATFGVIICMDALECYLHALRLVWVEWNSKYYSGTGYAFTPFVFKRVDDTVPLPLSIDLSFTVQMSSRQTPPVVVPGNTQHQLKSDSIYVSNLDAEIGEEELRNEVFTDCGVITDVVINYDRNGRSQGTATITFEHSADAQKACAEFDGAQVDGKVMRVKLVGALTTPKVVVKKTPPPVTAPAPTPAARPAHVVSNRAPAPTSRAPAPRAPAPRAAPAPRNQAPRGGSRGSYADYEEPHYDSRREPRHEPRHYDNAPRGQHNNAPRAPQHTASSPRRVPPAVSPRRGAAPPTRQPVAPRREARQDTNTRGGNARVLQQPQRGQNQRAASQPKRGPAQNQNQNQNQNQRQRQPAAKPQPKAKPQKAAPKPLTAEDLDRQLDAYNAQREAAKAGQP